MRILSLLFGVVCLFSVLLDAFQTIILPRRASGRFRLTRLFYIVTWRPWVFLTRWLHDYRKRDFCYSYYGPMSLIFLLVLWASVMVVGFALIFYGLGSPFHDAAHGRRISLRPLRQRHHPLHIRAGRRDSTQPLGPRASNPRSRHRPRFSRCCHGIFSRALRRLFTPRSQHLVARCARRLATHRGGTHATPCV